MSTPGNLAFRSPAARKLMKGTRKVKRSNNTYIPSNTEAPELNMSYLNERNFNVRKGLNQMVLESNIGRNVALTNNQTKARRNVAMKMARGESVSNAEKVAAGMISQTVANTRKYNNAVKSVTAKIKKLKANMKANPRTIPKPPYSKAEANILGTAKILELQRTVTGGGK